jgi:hypothetical protein
MRNPAGWQGGDAKKNLMVRMTSAGDWGNLRMQGDGRINAKARRRKDAKGEGRGLIEDEFLQKN